MDQRLLKTGLPNGWFQVAYSAELAVGEVVPLEYFGKKLVLFRTEAGEAQVLDAFCPHLGAHLGYGGTVQGNNIRCPFHAWEFDGRGACARLPYSEKIPRLATIHAWEVREKNGLIMVWYHSAGEPPSWELPTLEEYQHPDWTAYDQRAFTVRTCNQEMSENAVDSAHFRYVHGTTNLPKSQLFLEDHIMRVVSEVGMTRRGSDVPATIEAIAYGLGSFGVVRFCGIVETLAVSSSTPIDEERVHHRFSFSVKKLGAGDATATLGKAFVDEVVRQFEQDIPIWENKRQLARPLVVEGDGPIAQYRRWARQFFVSQPTGTSSTGGQ